MSKIEYEPRTFTAQGLWVIQAAEGICEDYAAQGYSLTLRQLYYRFIATDAFPESRRNAAGTKNHQQNYKWLGDLVANARVAGLIDWRHLEDRTRNLEGGDAGWPDPAAAIRSIERAYGITHWDGQPERVEVWVEKEALADVVSRPAGRWDVPYFACKGYVSISEMHEAANRLRHWQRQGAKVTIIHLGDHDPSGLDMTRDIGDRLAMFRCPVTVERVALNMDQIERLDPPPSPAKITDSRASDYISQYGDDSWELDAIEPAELETIVEDAILGHLDQDAYQARVNQENEERHVLTGLSDNWDEVEQYLRDNGMVPDAD